MLIETKIMAKFKMAAMFFRSEYIFLAVWSILRVAFHKVVLGGNNTAFLIPTNLYMNTLMYFLCSNVLFTRMSFRVQAISYIYIGKAVSNLG